ncbi:MAG: signal peptidase I, partial [Candidatus Pararuminococcus gallinarum]
FGILFVCNLTIIIKGTLNTEKPPSLLGVTPMVVLSGSMSGTQEGHIEVGDLIFVVNEEPEQLEIGDVIAYINEGTTVTHRITAIDTGEDDGLIFTTKGDANDAEDTEDVTEEQIIGVYQGRIPKVGDFALFLQKPLGMLLFIGIPLLAFIVYDILRRQRYANCEKAKTEEMEAELERLRSLSGKNSPSSAKSSIISEEQ